LSFTLRSAGQFAPREQEEWQREHAMPPDGMYDAGYPAVSAARPRSGWNTTPEARTFKPAFGEPGWRTWAA